MAGTRTKRPEQFRSMWHFFWWARSNGRMASFRGYVEGRFHNWRMQIWYRVLDQLGIIKILNKRKGTP